MQTSEYFLIKQFTSTFNKKLFDVDLGAVQISNSLESVEVNVLQTLKSYSH